MRSTHLALHHGNAFARDLGPRYKMATKEYEWCRTHIRVRNYSFEWKITNFKFHCESSDKLESPLFGDDLKWCLTTSTRDYGPRNSAEYIDVGLVLKSTPWSSCDSGQVPSKKAIPATFSYDSDQVRNGVRAEVTLTLCTSTVLHKGMVCFCRGTEHKFEIKKHNLLNSRDFSVNGTLAINCAITAHSTVSVESSATKKKIFPEVCDLGTILATALKEELFTDFTVAVGDREFKAHKFMLAVQSPVFKRMIENPMEESKESRVEIPDFAPEVVQEMLQFIYTTRAPNLKKMPKSLLSIADKYELSGLRSLCEEELCTTLQVGNAIDTLLLADMHSAQKLRVACVDFIVHNISEVKKTGTWNTLKTSTEYQDLYHELLESVVSSF